MRIAVAVLLLTQVLNLVLVPWLGHAGLALTIGLGALVNAAWLLRGLLPLRLLSAGAGLGRLRAQRGARPAARSAAALAWAAVAIDWIGLQAAAVASAPACWPRCWLASALLYFGVLAAAACELRAVHAARLTDDCRRRRLHGPRAAPKAPMRRTAVQGAHPTGVLRSLVAEDSGFSLARSGRGDRAGRIPRARRADGAGARSMRWRAAQAPSAGRRRAGAAPAPAEPLLLPELGFAGNVNDYYDRRQQLPERRAAARAAASRSRWRCCTSSWPPSSA